MCFETTDFKKHADQEKVANNKIFVIIKEKSGYREQPVY